jgi:hypothetical protein
MMKRTTERLTAIFLTLTIPGVLLPAQSATGGTTPVGTASFPKLTVELPAEATGRMSVFNEAGDIIATGKGDSPGLVEADVPEGSYWVAVSRADDPYPAIVQRADVRDDWTSVMTISELPYSIRHQIERTRADLDRLNRRLSRGRVARGVAYSLLTVATAGAGLATYSFVQGGNAVAEYNEATTTKDVASAREDAEHWGGLLTAGVVTATSGLAFGGGYFLFAGSRRTSLVERNLLERELERLTRELVTAEARTPLIGRLHG